MYKVGASVEAVQERVAVLSATSESWRMVELYNPSHPALQLMS